MPNKIEDFRTEIQRMLRSATKQGARYVEITSGEVHRRLGGYPSANHRMPVCCDAMYGAMNVGDKVIYAPSKGKGATLKVRYRLPR